MTQATIIRPAGPTDSDLVSRLIYLTMGIEADWLFGYRKERSTLQVLQSLFLHRNNRMGINLTYLAEYTGQACGLLLAFPGKLLSRLNWMTGWHFLQAFGPVGIAQLIWKQSAYGDLIETEVDEFYISNLAVLPEFQGKGIGRLMMEYAEKLAFESGLNKCSLIVALGHEKACKMYERLGYRIIQTYINHHPKVSEGSGGYHRMVKILELRNNLG
jgi:ribosomal protein S18 acetylase RimI-like enzyme